MTYQFLRDLEEEINPRGTKSTLWVEEHALFMKMMAYSGTPTNVLFPTCDIKFRLRGYAELSKWWKAFGLNECPVDKHVATWDEHRFQEAYEDMRMHQPFDMYSFLSAMDKLTGNDLIRFKGAILPEWVLSPSYNYVDEPSKLYRAMRDIWYGPRPKREYLEFSDPAIHFAWHHHHHFPYQPEPELWMFVAMQAKPSYAKGRLYALTVKRDTSVIGERFLNSLMRKPFTMAEGEWDRWKAGQQS